MFEKLENFFIKRNLKRREIKIEPFDNTKSAEFRRVLNTLRENKVMVQTRDDGIYIRLAGNTHKNQINTQLWGKVFEFNK